MVKLNKDKVQVRYITGINKTLYNYPTALDVLYESCMESIDDCLFSASKMENRYSIYDAEIEFIINELIENGYIEKKGSKYKITSTPWD